MNCTQGPVPSLKSDYQRRNLSNTGKYAIKILAFFLKIVGRYYGAGQIFKMDPDRQIHWPGTGKPPPDVPECGFLNESCNKGTNDTQFCHIFSQVFPVEINWHFLK